jgi:SAM-dependent methyltransferase
MNRGVEKSTAAVEKSTREATIVRIAFALVTSASQAEISKIMHELSDPSQVIRSSAQELYGSKQANWPPATDGWNDYKFSRMERFVLDTGSHLLPGNSRILDAGCGIGVYEWMPPRAINVDLFISQIRGRPNATVADIERLPFADRTFDLVFCLGSVLNYVSAERTLGEIARVSDTSALLYLHFEPSSSFEHIFKKGWNAPNYLNRTVNATREDYVWIYSPRYVFGLLASLGFKVRKTARFHILSSLFYKLGVPQDTAYKAARLDPVVPWLNFFADDVILLAEKVR